jgi:predicted DNA-binding protein (MmcQ/YjbR family)
MPDIEERLRDFALLLPGAWEDFPWGERVAKVGKRVFVFFGHDERRKDLRLQRQTSERKENSACATAASAPPASR